MSSYEMDAKLKFGIIIIVIFNCLSPGNGYMCDKNPCVYKCCPFNQLLNEGGECSQDEGASINFRTVPVYDKDVKKMDKDFRETFYIFVSKDQKTLVPPVSFYLIEDATLYCNISGLSLFYDNENFCLDNLKNNETNTVRFKITDVISHFREYCGATALLISCVFLLLVVIVHILFKELWNLRGMIWMFLTGNLFCAFAMLAAVKILSIVTDNLNKVICDTGMFIYIFFLLGSFCWLNVTSFNIWRNIKYTIRTDRDSYKRTKISLKFALYLAYSSVVPLLVSTIRTINAQPDSCFLNYAENWRYLCIPMLILIIVNWVFFVMTAFHIRTVMRDTRMVTERSTHKKNKKQFVMYIKLSILMGLSWLTEIISTLCPHVPIWYVTDAYNALIGIALFYIILCNKKVYTLFCKRFNIGYNFQSSSAEKTRNQTESTIEELTEDIKLNYRTLKTENAAAND